MLVWSETWRAEGEGAISELLLQGYAVNHNRVAYRQVQGLFLYLPNATLRAFALQKKGGGWHSREISHAQANDVLTAVCPCWMASPLSICQLIVTTGTFDYVIFDEASQVLPEDAVPAILRGKYVIVAGDNKQLPPSAFFAAAEEDDEADGDATAYESLLDMMIPFVNGLFVTPQVEVSAP